MIRPTRRAVLIFAGGLPLALLIVSVAPAAWVFTFYYGVLVLLVIAADALLACPPRRLTAVVETPDRLFIGEAGTITATLTTAGYRRGTRVELLAEQSGELDPATIVTADVPAGGGTTAALALLPRRRGRVVVRQLWLRWLFQQYCDDSELWCVWNDSKHRCWLWYLYECHRRIEHWLWSLCTERQCERLCGLRYQRIGLCRLL